MREKQIYIDELGVSDLSARVLATKDLSVEEAKHLLQDNELMNLDDEQVLQDVVSRILLAKKNKEKILVCGDYDCDGICATTILFDTLQKLDIESGFYIPNRIEEGYGLHPNTVIKGKEKGYNLLITVDNGVKAFEALHKARELGVEVIVTDHHHIEEEVPASMFLHQSLMSEAFENLSGAGIALELSRALLGREEPFHVVLAAIASIADVMRVRDETRTIIKKGINYLNTMNFPVIEALHPTGESWDEERIAFQVVPKLNATGRLADIVNVNNSVRYLMMNDLSQIQNVAKQINSVNDQRKEISSQIVDDIKTKLNNISGFYYAYGEDYHEGIVGLAAGSLASSLEAPVMVLSEDNGKLKGSIRSFNKVDLTTFFNEISDLFIAFGGHKAAAGMTFAKEDLDKVLSFIEKNYIPLDEDDSVDNYIVLSPSDYSVSDYEEMLSVCRPFGNGFEKPKFYIENPNIVKSMDLSRGKHLKLTDDSHNEYLLFNISNDDRIKLMSGNYALSCEVSISEFRGVKKVNYLVQKVIALN